MEFQVKNQFLKEENKIRVNQGDILKDVSILTHTGFSDESESIISKTNLPYALVVTQDCDLEHDFDNRNQQGIYQDKFLPNILLLPAYLSDKLREGTHLGDNIKGEQWNSKQWAIIKTNQHSRFHFINTEQTFQIPELVIDFKKIFAIRREILYSSIDKWYLASCCELYRDNISQRYTNYLSRIGLPDKSSE